MTRLARHARMAYLLALFQVLGGPALVCGIIGLARLASERQATLTQSAERAMQRLQHRHSAGTAPAASAPQSNEAGRDQPAAPSPEGGRVKFFCVIEIFDSSQIGVGFVRGSLSGHPSPLKWGAGEGSMPWQPPRVA